MFLPPDDAMRHLCDALYALREPDKLLKDHGLISIDKYVTYDENDLPSAVKPSWQELKEDFDQARSNKSEQLRNMCSELLRRRNDASWHYEHPLDNCPAARFQDSIALFEARLLAGGYKFDGFEIRDARTVPSVVQRADESPLEGCRLKPVS